MWVRSRDYLDGYRRVGLYVASYEGRVHLIRETGPGWMLRDHVGIWSIWMTEPNVYRSMVEPWEEVWYAGSNRVNFLGARFAHRSFPQINTSVTVLTVPHWMLCVATGVVPLGTALRC